jgi:hypothetical protein
MTDVDAERPDAYRLELLRRVFEVSSLDEVAEAVAVATEHERRVYVERLDGGYRWSPVHSGGAYPLLRITARFLRVDYRDITVAFRAVADAVYILSAEVQQATIADAWAVVDFDVPASSEETRDRIRAALSPRR